MVRTESAERQGALEAAVSSSIIDLRNGSIGKNDTFLRDGIIAGLKKTKTVVPGTTDEDLKYAHCKTIPTYDDLGLSIYDEITQTQDYYPFEAELRILKAYGPEIAARLFRLPTATGSTRTGAEKLTATDMRKQGIIHEDRESLDMGDVQNDQTVRHSRTEKQRWGDYSVGGANNNGVNGNLGLDETGSGGSTASLTNGLSNGTKREEANGHAAKRVKQHGVGGAIVELGAGSLKKTAYLLQGVAGLLGDNEDGQLKTAQYIALDVEPGQLASTLTALTTQHPSVATPDATGIPGLVKTGGLCATYDQGLEWLSSDPMALGGTSTRRALLWLGSSIGNLSPAEATTFLREKVAPALREGDTILIGVDNCKDGAKVGRAYDDREGVTRRFILNGVNVVGRELGLDKETWDDHKFEYVTRWNKGLSRHEAFLRAREPVTVALKNEEPINIAAGELIHIEASYKFSHDEAYTTFLSAGLRVVQRWTDLESVHSLYLLEKPGFVFSPEVEAVNGSAVEAQGQVKPTNGISAVADGVAGGKRSAANIPTRREWQTLWKAWDTVTLGMIPKHKLHSKPIDLRHICLFYLGHIPVFADIHISRYLKEPYTEPSNFATIFERGIDPDMDDPTKCHDHSIVPENQDEWPTLEEILSFRDRFRRRLFDVYSAKVESPSGPDRHLGRVLSMIFEHEGLHLETLLYMLNQFPPGEEGVIAPPGFTVPDWPSLAKAWDMEAAVEAPHAALEFPKTTFEIGHDDIEAEDATKAFDAGHSYGWDNESPRRSVTVDAFKLDAKPISNLEYKGFVEQEHARKPDSSVVPASWVELPSGEYRVRTVYGPVPFSVAQHWPVQASGAQLAQYAASKGGRLPTADELALFIRQSPTDTPITNVGFRNWHPVPPVAPAKAEDGSGWVGGSNGGVWEWTSTLFDTYPGFEKSKIYPGYSSDFFDGTHWVVLGGSWATIPRIAGRPSVRNWYQAHYPYVFAGGRVAYPA